MRRARRVWRWQMKPETTNFGEESARTASIPELFEACMAKEERLLSSNYKKNLLALYKHILFGPPVFWPDPIAGYPPFEEAYNKSSAPFTFSVARRGNETSSVAEWKYQKLLELLREQKDAELRWLLLARWLKQEIICEPEKFLPKPILDRLIRRFLSSSRISAADLSYWVVITGWKTYFGRLQADLQKVQREQRDPQPALEEMGYDAAAVRFAITKKTIASAIMHWIAERRHLPVETLQNAYSRMRGDSRRRPASIL